MQQRLQHIFLSWDYVVRVSLRSWNFLFCLALITAIFLSLLTFQLHSLTLLTFLSHFLESYLFLFYILLSSLAVLTFSLSSPIHLSVLHFFLSPYPYFSFSFALLLTSFFSTCSSFPITFFHPSLNSFYSVFLQFFSILLFSLFPFLFSPLLLLAIRNSCGMSLHEWYRDTEGFYDNLNLLVVYHSLNTT